jgi:hypothetical protein
MDSDSNHQPNSNQNSDEARDGTEADVPRDNAVAGSRATGGVADADAPDANSTTGTTPSEEFVGRIAGQDVGYAGETGAERRAAVNAQEAAD